MEPPAKRIRVMKSGDVDEDKAEFFEARQRQQQELKSKFESLFEKFSNMHPSQSDEIDMKTNSVVVDRGHLRRLGRQNNGEGESLLEDSIWGHGIHLEGDEDDEEEAEGEDSEDELAPPQLVEPKTAGSCHQGMSTWQTKAADVNAGRLALPHSIFPTTSMPRYGVPQTPNTPNSTADLPRYFQFQQTPAVQQAQIAFHGDLLQTIDQAVRQAVVGFLLPNIPMSLANVATAPTTPMTAGDKVAPATDPKWFFPPLSAQQQQSAVTQPSPLPYHTAAPIAKQTVRQCSDIASKEATGEKASVTMPRRLDESSSTRPRRRSSCAEIQRRVPRNPRKYHFTYEDDVYISERKRIGGVSWAAIKDSRPKWRDWPVSALHNRWSRIKDQDLHLKELDLGSSTRRVDGGSYASTKRTRASSKTTHNLPTPSPSENGECHRDLYESAEENAQDLLLSSSHFDNDDQGLPSPANHDTSECETPMSDDDDTNGDIVGEAIPLSIETTNVVSKDTVQDSAITSTRQSPYIAGKAKPSITSPTTIGPQSQHSPAARITSNSQETKNNTKVDFVIPHTPYAHKRRSRIAKHTDVPPTHLRNVHTSPVPRSPLLVSVVCSVEDKLPPSLSGPAVPSLERGRGSSTSSTAIHSTSFRIPKVCIIHEGTSDRGSNSMMKCDRKAFYRQVKRGWSRKGRRENRSTVDRKSLGDPVVRKNIRVDVDGDGSKNETAAF